MCNQFGENHLFIDKVINSYFPPAWTSPTFRWYQFYCHVYSKKITHLLRSSCVYILLTGRGLRRNAFYAFYISMNSLLKASLSIFSKIDDVSKILRHHVSDNKRGLIILVFLAISAEPLHCIHLFINIESKNVMKLWSFNSVSWKLCECKSNFWFLSG